MSNIPRWNDVRADFGDTGRTLSAVQQGLSNAGTIFGQLRASILEEEQRRVDNALKEKAFNEGVRQFGITSAETARGHDLNYKASMAGHSVARANALTSANTARERLLYDMANTVAEATETVPAYYGTGNQYNQPQQFHPGNYTRIVESNGNSSAVNWNDNGKGISVGDYQLNEAAGSIQAFINTMSKINPNIAKLNGLKGQELGKAWQSLVASGDITHQMQQDFVMESHYKPAIAKLQDANLQNLVMNSPNLQTAMFDMAIQHGATGAANLVNSTYRPGMSEQQIIEAASQKRGERYGQYGADRSNKLMQHFQQPQQYGPLSAKGKKTLQAESDRLRQEEFGKAWISFMQSYQESEKEESLLKRQRDSYPEGSPERKEIEDKITQLKANRKYENLAQLNLALTMQYGSPEQKLAIASSEAKKEHEIALLNAEAKREAGKTKTQYTRQDAQAIDKNLATIDNPDARVAAWRLMHEIALREDISSEEKVTISSIISGADTRSLLNPINWVRGTSNEAIIDNVLVQIRKKEGSPTDGNQSTWSDKFEQTYGVGSYKNLKDKGFTDSDISNVDKFARLFAKNQQGFLEGFSNKMAQTTGIDWLARNVFDSNTYSDPEPSPDDFEHALKFMTKVKKDRDTKAKAKQTATAERQAQINRRINGEAAPKRVHEVRRPVTNELRMPVTNEVRRPVTN